MTRKPLAKIRPNINRGQSAPILDQPPSTSPASSTESSRLHEGTKCVICGSTSCSLLTHRLHTLKVARSGLIESTKRRRGSQSPSTSPFTIAGQELESSAFKRDRQSPATAQSVSLSNDVLAVIGDGVLLELFYRFFNDQSHSLLQFQRSLSFDSADFAPFADASTTHPAMALSFVAMAATFNSIDRQGLVRPDAALSAVYGQAFSELRIAIDTESNLTPSEATLIAAANLCFCSGIAFCNAADAHLHWQGVLALLKKPRHQPLAGAISMLLVQLEHWLVVMAVTTPRHTDWHEVLPHRNPPPQKYGVHLDILTPLLDTVDVNLSRRILHICETACRAVELLEHQARRDFLNGEKPYDTYFLYLRNVVTDANAVVYSQTNGTDTLAECINLAVSLFLLIALRRTPWKAPVAKLCNELKRCITQTMLYRVSERQKKGDISNVESSQISGNDEFWIVYVWTLHTCAVAARWCFDQSLVQWTDRMMQPVIAGYIERYEEEWRATLEQDLTGMVWSTVFLWENISQIWTECESLSS